MFNIVILYKDTKACNSLITTLASQLKTESLFIYMEKGQIPGYRLSHARIYVLTPEISGDARLQMKYMLSIASIGNKYTLIMHPSDRINSLFLARVRMNLNRSRVVPDILINGKLLPRLINNQAKALKFRYNRVMGYKRILRDN